jgi:hypothetical protein
MLALHGLFDHDDGGQSLQRTEGGPLLWQREVGAAGAQGRINPSQQVIYHFIKLL